MSHCVFYEIGEDYHPFPKYGMDPNQKAKLNDTLRPQIIPEEYKEFFPSEMRLDAKPTKTLSHFLSGPGGFAISHQAREIIESLEPDVHIFKELESFDETGTPFKENYHLFIVQQFIDALNIEKSNVKWIESRIEGREALKSTPLFNGDGTPIRTKDGVCLNPDGSIKMRLQKAKGPISLSMKKDLIQNKHVWILKSYFTGYFFFSDELMRRLLDAGIEGIRSYHAEDF